jgi:hypothetical protein
MTKKVDQIMEKIKALELAKEQLIQARKNEIAELFLQHHGLGISNQLILGFIARSLDESHGAWGQELLHLGELRLGRKKTSSNKVPSQLSAAKNNQASNRADSISENTIFEVQNA